MKEAMRSLGSMLNKNGYGSLYFGVKDNGDVTGQQIGDRTLREISQAIANSIKPQVIPTITVELMDDKNVVKVEVQGGDAPYSSSGKYYIRSADEDRELSPGQLRDLMFRRGGSDIISRKANDEQNLSFRMLKTLYASKGLTVNNDSFEQNLGLHTENGTYNMMAGLLADENNVSIKVSSFQGKDKSRLIKRNEYGYKCLPVAMDQVLSYMESINETRVEITPHGREETSLFDMLSFREAWINACLHTKWEKNNPPAVYIFRNRIEIISTGGLPEDLTREEFFKGISRPINTKLQKIFGQLGYVEQTGHGIPLIVSNYGKQAFEIMDNYINVVIPLNRKKETPEYEEFGRTNNSQRLIIDLLKDNPELTIREMVEESGLSDGYVRKILSELKNKNIIQRMGSNRAGYWEVEDK